MTNQHVFEILLVVTKYHITSRVCDNLKYYT